MEVIRLVEQSSLSVKKTLAELDINRSTFYGWYGRYLDDGYDGLADKKPVPRKFWNKIPDHEKQQIVDIALKYAEKSPRELAWFITDNQGYFISESSVYRILKTFDLITSPAYSFYLLRINLTIQPNASMRCGRPISAILRLLAGAGIICLL